MEDSNDKVYGILSYLGLLVIISIVMGKSQFARFHANQGLVLMILEFVCSIVLSIGMFIPGIRIIFMIIGGLLWLPCLALAIFGIVTAANGEMREIPVIGTVKLIK